MSWSSLPPELRLTILEELLRDNNRLANFATVSREWQMVIERHNFSWVKLTPSRARELVPMLRRNRHAVRYLWFCLELHPYDCSGCSPLDPSTWGMAVEDNILITTAIHELFTNLSTWQPSGDLLLDISVHAPSDVKHYFKYLTNVPDIPQSVTAIGRSLAVKWLRPTEAPAITHDHGWGPDGQSTTPPAESIEKLFEEIMGEGPFDNDDEEAQWWQALPLVPAVTGLLLRQQTRRRWKPTALAHMISRLPGIKNIHYEPWREWEGVQQMWTDRSMLSLLDGTKLGGIESFTLFENFNPSYSNSLARRGCHSTRIPSAEVSQAVAKASLRLKHLSAAFLVEANDFFNQVETDWAWHNLEWLSLTSALLVPEADPVAQDAMLIGAASAARKMPRLSALEIWTCAPDSAMVFKHQKETVWRSPELTWRATWAFVLRPLVLQAWDSFALQRNGQRHIVHEGLLLSRAGIKTHADAIKQLELARSVISPVSLRQIQLEHEFREGVGCQHAPSTNL